MRFVDIAQIALPNGWQARADAALEALRSEILAAEREARNAGQDAAAARKAAIAAGVSMEARRQIWRDLDAALAALSNGKCWYSESRNPTADKNVDHFRPKSRVHDDPSHEGYWWLTFSWRNYRYSSQWCNQRRVDDGGGTSGGKWDRFPLCPGSIRARLETDDIDQENPELLDPVDPDDWRLLTYRPDGHPIPTKPAGTLEHRRATTSIDVYHLHCKALVDDRRIVAGSVQRLVQDLQTLRPRIDDPKVRAVYKSRQIDLLRTIHHDSDYSAAALAYARAEIYTLERGQQVQREWLKEMLS